MTKSQTDEIAKLAALLERLAARYAISRKDAAAVREAVESAATFAPKLGGRPPTIDVERARAMRAEGKTLQEIADEFGCTRQAVSKLLKK